MHLSCCLLFCWAWSRWRFLPISSSGHLAIAEHLLASRAIEVPGFYDVLLHLGTLVAVFIAYWQDIRDMILELIDGVRDLARGTTPNPVPPARRMILLIIVGTLPLFIVLPVKGFLRAWATACTSWPQPWPVRRHCSRKRPGPQGPQDGEKRLPGGCAAGGRCSGHCHLPRHLPLRHHHYRRVLRGL